MQTILSLDTQLTHILSYIIPHNDLIEQIFTFLSLEGNYIFIWAVAFGILFFFKGKTNWRFPVTFILTLLFAFALVDLVFKPLFGRDRPYVVQQIDSLVCPQTFSFPSGHAAGSFAGATILAFFDKRRRKWYYIGAVLISYSRIFLQCHYVLDVVFGALLGYLISKGVLVSTSYSIVKDKIKRI